MIERMTRFNVVLYHGDVESFMERLRELGVADVTLSDWEPSPEQRERMARAERYKNAYMRLGAVKRGRAEKDAEEEKRDVAPFDTVEEAVEALEGATERIAQLETLRMKATAELDGLAMWGEFDPAEIRRLREAEGIALRFFEVPTKQYRTEWEWEYPIQVVVQNLGGMTYFVVAQPVGEAGAATEAIGLGTAAVELRAPEMTFTQKELQIETYLREEAQKQEVIARAALSRDRIWADYVELKNGIAFDEALHAGTEYAEGTVKVVEAWVPTPLKTKLEEFLDGQPVVWAEEEARVEQNPPIKLKNHFFARLFEPIGSLYMLPRYNEIDITPFFAPFFMLFFGMCFGDAGYGVLFILAIVLFWRKIPVRFRDFAWLALFLNIATVFFGLLTGNVFGIELAKVPELVRFKEYFVSNENMFNVAVGLGAAQILFGMILRIFNRWKQNGSFLYGLSTLGWVIIGCAGGGVLCPAGNCGAADLFLQLAEEKPAGQCRGGALQLLRDGDGGGGGLGLVCAALRDRAGGGDHRAGVQCVVGGAQREYPGRELDRDGDHSADRSRVEYLYQCAGGVCASGAADVRRVLQKCGVRWGGAKVRAV
nr:V-type ATPase 116kDa subunit family protein [uncultured Rikenella sp.]